MTYSPTTWKDGDLVTSAKLNKIEQGIAAGGGFLVVNDIDGTLDKTWQEIYDAGCGIIIQRWDGFINSHIIMQIGVHDNDYYVTSGESMENSDFYKTNNPSEYPIHASQSVEDPGDKQPR